MTQEQQRRNVLVVDDELPMRAALEANFRRHGWNVDTSAGPHDAVRKFCATMHPLVITDIHMPDGDGLSFMRQVQSIAPHTAVILLTAYANVSEAVHAMKNGACDYLVKPISFEHLQAGVERIMTRRGMQALGQDGDIVGHSPALLNAIARARQVAATDADILVEAESGTGKELLARLIHKTSRRCKQSLVAVNCAAVPEHLLESELFGHVRGAFTGATVSKAGKFEQAHGGTLLLDEVGEMPLALQPKLLRALQEREFDRLGDTHPVKVNIRVIATTNRSLRQMVADGRFRADLYYRLNVIPLSLPPLRERREDIPDLAYHFARKYMVPGRSAPRLSSEFLACLERYDWPGNVRELANFMQRVMALCSDPVVGPEFLDSLLSAEIGSKQDDNAELRPGVSLRDAERRLLEVTLRATDGNRTRAAEMLGVSLRTVRNKIRDYGLPRRSYA
ncbi:MAG TPA: sigma-54 dependent transcriptional regulator [Terriglobales bacterium]|nr:sigma-54 dependent transcriptional regulator [Terriglobales bacterium]